MVGDTSIGDRCAEHRSGLNRLPSGVLENDGCQSASDGPGCLDAVVGSVGATSVMIALPFADYVHRLDCHPE
jgi:hypothetical protein